MIRDVYRFEFEPTVPLTEAELTLHLAIYAAEGLHGEARVRLEVNYHLDTPRNAIIVDGGTEVGAALVKVFTHLLIRQFGEDGFHVRRVEPVSAETPDPEASSRQTAAAPAAA